MGDSVSGKGGCVMRDADHDGTPVGKQIIDAVWYGHAGGIRAEIVIVDQARGPIPTCAGVLEITDQFPLFGVDAYDGVAAALEPVSKIAQVEELIVAVGTVAVGAFLVIDAKGIACARRVISGKIESLQAVSFCDPRTFDGMRRRISLGSRQLRALRARGVTGRSGRGDSSTMMLRHDSETSRERRASLRIAPISWNNRRSSGVRCASSIAS